MGTALASLEKGKVVQEFAPWRVIPLFVESSEDLQQRRSLPRYSDDDPTAGKIKPLPTPVKHFVDKLLQRNLDRDIKNEIIVGFYLVANGDAGNCFNGDASCIEDTPLVEKSWDLIKESIEYEQWKALISFVRSRILVVAQDHPISTYASFVAPNLDHVDMEKLQGNMHVSSILAAMKKLQDSVEPRLYAVLKDAPRAEVGASFVHSCLPSCVLELKKSQISVVPLYDTKEAEVSLCLVEDLEHGEERDTAIQRRTGSSCTCPRCRYELSSTPEGVSVLSVDDATRLGHYYMSKSRFTEARALYNYALSRDKNQPDLWHALGAISLSMGNFLIAQRLWSKAAADHPSVCLEHKGIALQLEKIKCYGYLEEKPMNPPVMTTKYDFVSISPAVQAFVASGIVAPRQCAQIIDWAESGCWTKQRHYAVPTHDVPIHSVPCLLAWFNEFMVSMRPLLAKQFNTTSNFFVHDAFCVKYEATKTSNHLPIHTDESTHSFVIALNEGYGGGGTHFSDCKRTARLRTGDVLSFRGDTMSHGGEAVTSGIRYIIAAFLYHDSGGTFSSNSGDSSARKKRSPDQSALAIHENKVMRPDFSFGFHLPG